MIYENEPTVPPILQRYGRAWRVKGESWIDDPRMVNDCGTWLVWAPGAHPFWEWYSLGCIALRSFKGEPEPPYIEFPGASHELYCLALSPEHPLPDPDRWGDPGTPRPVTMMPPDQIIQFIVADDLQGREVLDLVVKHIVLDGVSPDSDHRAYWKSAVANTAEHVRLGGHPGVIHG